MTKILPSITAEALRATLRNSERSSQPILDPAGLGAVVRERRRELDLTQAEVAGYAGVGRRFMGELEDGKPTIRIDKALKVLAALGIQVIAVV